MVESTGLENRRTRKGTVSSNLTLSVAARTSQYGHQIRWPYCVVATPRCALPIVLWRHSPQNLSLVVRGGISRVTPPLEEDDMDKPKSSPKTGPHAVESLPEKPVTDTAAQDVKGGRGTADPIPPVQGLIDRSF